MAQNKLHSVLHNNKNTKPTTQSLKPLGDFFQGNHFIRQYTTDNDWQMERRKGMTNKRGCEDLIHVILNKQTYPSLHC